MAQEPEQDKPPGENRWKYPIAAIVVLAFVGLTIYQTVHTGEIPYTIAVPLLAAALFALWTFKASDFTGGGK